MNCWLFLINLTDSKEIMQKLYLVGFRMNDKEKEALLGEIEKFYIKSLKELKNALENDIMNDKEKMNGND